MKIPIVDINAKDRNPRTNRIPWCCRSAKVQQLWKTKLPEVDTTLATADGTQPRPKPMVKNSAIVPRLIAIPLHPTMPYLSIRALSRSRLLIQRITLSLMAIVPLFSQPLNSSKASFLPRTKTIENYLSLSGKIIAHFGQILSHVLIGRITNPLI
jgi:hypothetical protein